MWNNSQWGCTSLQKHSIPWFILYYLKTVTSRNNMKKLRHNHPTHHSIRVKQLFTINLAWLIRFRAKSMPWMLKDLTPNCRGWQFTCFQCFFLNWFVSMRINIPSACLSLNTCANAPYSVIQSFSEWHKQHLNRNKIIPSLHPACILMW